MARARLGDMLAAVDDSTARETPAAGLVEAPGETPTPPAAATPSKRTTQRSSAAPPKSRQKATEEAASTPRYLELVRKEARLSDDQLQALTTLTRQLNKTRRGAGDRITDNTLIRVAVDLMLTQADKLTGTTEDELRKSLGL